MELKKKMARRNKTIARSTRFAPTFETLEARQLLAANVLANGLLEDINLNNANDVHSLQLDITGNEPVILALDMSGENGLDPGSIGIQSISGHTIAPIASSNTATHSSLLVELGPGSYEITVMADGGTTGRYDFSVSLVGDMDQDGSDTGDGQVSNFEQMWAQAAIAQSRGMLNGYAAAYYAQFGIPVGENLYDMNLDANRNGVIDPTDFSCITSNVGKASFTLELTNDSHAPVIAADLANDTGTSDTDGISSDITITGNVTDQEGALIVAFRAGIDDMAQSNYVDILAEVDANGNFTLDRAKLETIAGVSLDDGQEHTLLLIATDEYDNQSEQAYTVNFTLDITPPVAPETPDLTAASDLGYSDTDNLTADNTPTFTIVAEPNSIVKLYSDVAGLIGEGTADASGNVTITSIELADGVHNITAKAIDIAGNVGAVSTGLAVTIDTTLPTAPNHDLAVASDTGTVGDQYTSETTVTIEGTTDPNTEVTLVNTGAIVTSDASGHFSFSGVALAFGENDITLRARSESGALNEATVTYTQNNAPTSTTIDPLAVNENDGEVGGAALSNIFSDVNIADGDSLSYEVTSELPAWLTDISIYSGMVFVTTEGELYGTSDITIRATDTYGEWVDGTFSLTVNPENDVPTLSTISPFLYCMKNESLTVENIWKYFADEETPSSELTVEVASTLNGNATIVGDTLTYTPNSGYYGMTAIKFNVTDKEFEGIEANTTELTLWVTVASNYPVAAYDVSDSVNEDNVLDIQITDAVAEDYETALGDLTFEITSGTDLGGGQFQITGGTIQIVEESGNRYFRFTPNQDFNGETSFTYQVTDEPVDPDPATSASATVTITVIPVNDAPVTVDDSVAVSENGSVDGNVLEGDSDVENDTLEVTSLNVTSDEGIDVSIASDGSFTYNLTGSTKFDYLAVGETATDSFEYTISDGNGGTATGTVEITITGTNDEPDALDDTAGLLANAWTSGNVLSNDLDPDNSDHSLFTVTSLNIISTEGFTVAINQDGSYTYDLTGITSYAGLKAGEEAYDSFTYTMSDGNGGTSTATVNITITGVNDPPVAEADSAAVNENSSVGGNVLTNDTDPESDTLEVTSTSVTSTKGINVTIGSDGSFTYDITDSTVFDYLPAGVTTTDTFNYTVSDGDKTSTGTATITITGVNDAPVGENDTPSTNKTAPIDINVLANDTDVDSTILTVDDLPANGLSDKGATISLNTDGTIHYDPTTSSALQNLGVDDTDYDTFTYTVSDGSLNSQTVTVTIAVTGFQNTPPQLDYPIADMTLADGDDQPALIDLTTVFSDFDNHTLEFTATSSNTELVTVQIVNGTQLQVNYVNYTANQDRTPADITVTATEVGIDDPQSIGDEFTVTVTPEQPMGFYLVARNTATDETTAEMTTTLPDSIGNVNVGEYYVVEIWIMDSYPHGAAGVAGAQGDLGWVNKSLSSATSMGFKGYYDDIETAGTIENNNGQVAGFGGSTLHNGAGLTPYYSRLGYVVFHASAAGTQEFTFSPDTVSLISGGTFDTSQLKVEGVSVVQDPVGDQHTYTTNSSTLINVTGEVGGVELDPTPNDAGESDFVSGSQVIAFSNDGSKDYITFVSGSLNPTSKGPNLRPGIGGADTSAPGDFALSNDSIEIAIRDLAMSLSSDPLELTSGTRFSASNVNVSFSLGTIDYRFKTSGIGGTIQLNSKNVSIATDKTGQYTTEGGNMITYRCQYTVDLSDVLGTDSYLVFDLTYEAYEGTPIMGTVAAEDTPTDVALSVVKDPTVTDAKGEVNAIPQSETWIDEWDTHWVEIWVKTDEGSGVNSANVDLAYNPAYFTATEIEYGSALIGDLSGDISVDGLVAGFGGTFDPSGVGADGYVLLGRVKFESLADDGVEIDAESFGSKPLDLGLELTINSLEVEGVTYATVGIESTPNTELWAVPYDINDDNTINLADVLEFVSMFNTNVLDSGNALAQAVDYNNDGVVNLSDLLNMLSNYRMTKGAGGDISFPENFTQRWIGSGLDITGDSSAGELLDAATAIWQQMLGTDKPIDIQLVVTNLGGKQLAEAEILATDENGMPIAGRVTLDDDAAGLGWYSQIDGTPDAAMYDLYTVMLHEIGHTLGFMGSYDGFAENFDIVDGKLTFVNDTISVTMDDLGSHVADADLSGDLMSSTLDPGVRKLPSTLDAQMILAAYAAAEGGASGFAAISAPITAGYAVQAASISTAEFDRLDGPLVGEMTWAKLLETRSEKNNAELDATDVLFTYESTETPAAPVRSDSTTEDDKPLFDFAEDLVEQTTTDEVVDNVFDGWTDLLGDF